MKRLAAIPFVACPIGSTSFAQKCGGETARYERYTKARHKVRTRSRGSDEWPSL